jgi:hypothetical protein
LQVLQFAFLFAVKQHKDILNAYKIAKNALADQQNPVLETPAFMSLIVKILGINCNHNNLIAADAKQKDKRGSHDES